MKSNDIGTQQPAYSWVSGFTQQDIAQLTGDPRYLRFNVLIREDAKGTYWCQCKGSPFSSIILRPWVFHPHLGGIQSTQKKSQEFHKSIYWLFTRMDNEKITPKHLPKHRQKQVHCRLVTMLSSIRLYQHACARIALSGFMIGLG